MHNLLNGRHGASEILLDNMLAQPFLRRYAAVVLPDVQCLSDASARELARYVEDPSRTAPMAFDWPCGS